MYITRLLSRDSSLLSFNLLYNLRANSKVEFVTKSNVFLIIRLRAKSKLLGGVFIARLSLFLV